MKSPLSRFRGFGLNQNRSVESGNAPRKKSRSSPSRIDELIHAGREVQEMRDCYDGMLSAAAATANSVYEFSEALDEMGTCFLERTALSDDDDCGRLLMQLGKAQFVLQELVNSYRLNVIDTITTPSESLLRELQTVEEMKRQCDEKKDYYVYVVTSYRERTRRGMGPRNTRRLEHFTSEDVHNALQNYQDDAALFIFRLKSLQQGRFRSLLIQASRHHAAQLSFFRRGLKHLESIEPQMKRIAEQQHIDYKFKGVEESEDEEILNVGSIDDEDEDSSIEFDPPFQSPQLQYKMPSLIQHHVEMSRDGDVPKLDKMPANPLRSKPARPVLSQSAPLMENQPTVPMDAYERFRNMRPSSTRTLHTYALPLPDESRNPKPSKPNAVPAPLVIPPKPNINAKPTLFHSSPLPQHGGHNLNIPKPSNPSKSGPVRMPPQNIRGREPALSGPILPPPSGPLKPDFLPAMSGMPAQKFPKALNRPTRPPPRTASSPMISELHELPRPPTSNSGPVPLPIPQSVRPSHGYSGPLMQKRQVAFPLPIPPQATLNTTLSIPNSQVDGTSTGTGTGTDSGSGSASGTGPGTGTGKTNLLKQSK